ncbi:type VI secretion system tip protein VgrG [Roseomonas frigidaquae]|uniref:Type VI secretion system tip protein VgrG n=1 Tax=Falsiroseomonas frigidaquae TaxID=487318 RepID=A0ABX1F3I9_9PROT|nr:type VI secretion system tip protein TssI/VgrG [Falsiroseomonas frigidaquae]NKE46926.1 type VI secretion system tip protein VgrG [Falsiroseomonas frigidaquae]
MQPPRLLGIKTHLPDRALMVVRLNVTEELGTPYAIEAEVLGEDPDLLPESLLTKDLCITVTQHGPSPLVRHFHGVVAEFQRLGPGPAGRMAYRLVAVPNLWRLGLRRNCRIFQDKTVQEVVKAVLSDHGLAEPKWSMLPGFQPMPYCTQFNETDLHFVSRLLEEHGLTYSFTHSASGHEMNVAYSAQGFPQYVVESMTAEHGAPQLDHLGGWRRINRARSAMTKLDDMDSERSRPSEVLHATRQTRTYVEEAQMWAGGEVFHWPGGMSTRPDLESGEVLMGAQEAASEEYGADARDPRFAPGVRLFVGVKREDGSLNNRQFLVTGARHQASDTSGLVAGAGQTEHYAAQLRLVFAGRVWMPQPRHTRPIMPGMHSAKVTGPKGEKIHLDEFGRVKLRFRWDRWAEDDDTSSIWVRVMQTAAGAWGGTWFPPRVGDEVLVAFLDGDPDRPIVVGSVYGKDAPPPFKPGTNKAQSGILTRSYKSDSAADANMLRFEDKKGSEDITLHAQKDLTVEVENDEKRTIGHNQTEVVQNARTVTVKDADDTLTLEKGNRTETIKMGNDSLAIEMGNRDTVLKMGNDSTNLKLGNLSIKCDLGAITLEAMQSITLKVGQSSLVVDQTGITLKGMLITSEAQLVHKVKGLMVQEKGDALIQVEGALVMIN